MGCLIARPSTRNLKCLIIHGQGLLCLAIQAAGEALQLEPQAPVIKEVEP